MFTICQGTCFCTASPEGKRGHDTVLYCFGEVVLKKDSLRGEKSAEKALGPESLDQYHLQLTQLVLVFILFMLV